MRVRMQTYQTAEDDADGSSEVSILNEFLSGEWDGYIVHSDYAPLSVHHLYIHSACTFPERGHNDKAK